MTRAMNNQELVDAVSKLAAHYSTEAKPFEVIVSRQCPKCGALRNVFVAPQGICAMCWMIATQDAIDFLLDDGPVEAGKEGEP